MTIANYVNIHNEKPLKDHPFYDMYSIMRSKIARETHDRSVRAKILNFIFERKPRYNQHKKNVIMVADMNRV